jgi:predicted NBD/HSP70 family sugar kinase
MYLAIDIGGTKTLIAVFDKSGNVIDQYKFATNKVYTEFTAELSGHIAEKFAGHTFLGCCCAVPGQIDQKKGVALHEGNLPWTDSAPIKKDLENLLPHTPVFIENDAKLAGLSEALAHKQSKTVLYLTVSTGIGAGVIVDGKIDPTLSKSEPGQMILEFDGKLDKWENFASGRALVAKYGKRASEIDDPAIWQEFSRALARGLIELIAIVQPDLIIVGGGVGSHFEKFSKPLNEQLAKLANEMVNVPTIIKANKPEEAVIYGCYDLINQKI